MKKLILIILSILFITPAFADYKPIPKELSKQYKIEIEKTIKNRYPQTINEIHNISKEASIMYKKVLNNEEPFMDFWAKQYDMTIDSPQFYLYLDLIKITRKYAEIEDDDIPYVDYSKALHDFLLPYLKDNAIRLDKLKRIDKITKKEYIKIEKYYDNANKSYLFRE